MRRVTINRKTNETAVRAILNIDGRGKYKVSTGIRFFDHMLELFARHGGFDLELRAEGDLDVDQHHTVEDVGIVLGEAFHHALGSKRGILREKDAGLHANFRDYTELGACRMRSQ